VEITRIERTIVACYDAAEAAHFRPHRDNTTRGTAHRKFAVTINLNDDYAGGDLAFPEYGPLSHRPPPGAALVFSCSLLHAVAPMRRGRRYAFLPFLYDEAGAQLRDANRAYLAQRVEA
jgi:predicted 2-oxoglutarate/Fe(II)-dependent dioxygenase YbiX